MKQKMRNMAALVLIVFLAVCVAALPGYSASVTGRDGRFIAYDDGTVLDTRTNLMWPAKDNGGNVNWFNAKNITENFRVGGYMDWRMPTVAELETLYDGRKLQNVECGGAPVHLATDLIKLTCRYAWSSERQGGEFAYFFFDRGYSRFYPQAWDGLRILPVRLGGR